VKAASPEHAPLWLHSGLSKRRSGRISWEWMSTSVTSCNGCFNDAGTEDVTSRRPRAWSRTASIWSSRNCWTCWAVCSGTVARILSTKDFGENSRMSGRCEVNHAAATLRAPDLGKSDARLPQPEGCDSAPKDSLPSHRLDMSIPLQRISRHPHLDGLSDFFLGHESAPHVCGATPAASALRI